MDLQDALKAFEPTRRDYAKLATTHIRDGKKEETYGKAYDEFPNLLQHLGFDGVSISLPKELIVFATKKVILPGSGNSLFEVGQLLIITEVKEKKFKFQNVTRTIDGYHHPHINTAGGLCISTGSQALNMLLVDGHYLDFFDYLWEILHTMGGNPYQASVEKWLRVR